VVSVRRRTLGSSPPRFQHSIIARVANPLGADEQLAALGTGHDASALAVSAPPPEPGVSLAEAYRICQQITREHSKSFFFSSQLLPGDKRRSIRVLYAFCRTSDDTVDHGGDDGPARLAAWVQQIWHPEPARHPVLIAWNDLCRRYTMAPQLTKELLAGIAMDLTITRYATFADLWLYCYRVASVVGLMSMQIVGFAPGAEPYAIKLGVALQLTNILRDIAEDAERGRVYLPQDELAAFGLSDAEILAGVADARMRALMRFQVERAHRLYEESWPGIALLRGDSRFAVGAAATVYRGILDKIEAADYDPFSGRAHLTLKEKLRMLPSIWLDVRALGAQKSC
jgi:15-cis-phytoene synthase